MSKIYYVILLKYFYYIGIGQTQLSELSASIDIPSISSTAYLTNLSNMSDLIQDSAIEEMIKAGDEERRIALQNGKVDKYGVPMCTVIADGQWLKRSYRTKYNAFSGAVRKLKLLIFT